MNDVDQTNATENSIDDHQGPARATRRSILRTVGAVGAGAVAGPAGTGFAGASEPPKDDDGSVKPVLAASVTTAEVRDVYNHHAGELPGWLRGFVGGERIAVEISKPADQAPAIEDQVIRRVAAETDLTREEATDAVNALSAATDSVEPRVHREGR